MTDTVVWWILALAALDGASVEQPIRPSVEVHDLVILHGRVLDPASGFDGLANLGITGGVIRALTSGPIQGRDTVDAAGLVVAPGFIDLLSYEPNPIGSWNKVADGVTTALAMHGGTTSPGAWYARVARRRPPLNYGASFFHTEARHRLQLGRNQRPTAGQVAALVAMAERALREGALGVSISPEYIPGTTADEVIPLLRLARQYDVPAFFHARYSDMEEPGTNFDALRELVGYARETGASIHIEHLNSTGGTFSMPESLRLLEDARREGLDITACTYPYDFWATYLNSARFDAGWQDRFRITYADLQLGGSPERLTERTFAKYRKEGKLVVAYAIPEQDVIDALRSPFVMIGSDAILEPGYNNHPRASGTFARTIGRYVRERGVLSLMDAVAKMTILPARRMERAAPAMRRKGRIAEGADADVTVFDYARIADQATVEHPEYRSAGIQWVIVNGTIVKDPDRLRTTARPGRPVRGVITDLTPIASARQ